MTSIYGTNYHEYPKKNGYNEKTTGRIIGNISGGVASAVACHLALEKYGDRVDLVFCDTKWENDDTFRFMSDLENMWGKKIRHISSSRFNDPEEVWDKYLGLNFAHGAPCSMALKREVRIKEQKLDDDFGQIFGFDYDKKEIRRAEGMLKSYPEINAIFPLIIEKYDRARIFAEIKKWGIKVPMAYKHFKNNNCLGNADSSKGGCVQGGIGYWQQMQEFYPLKFQRMAAKEHELSIKKGQPVTICKDQGAGERKRVFLKHCKEFPEVGDISTIKGRRPVSVMECNGFCQLEMF